MKYLLLGLLLLLALGGVPMPARGQEAQAEDSVTEWEADSLPSDTSGRRLLGWRLSAMAGVNFTSTHVSQNWQGAEGNAYALSIFGDGTARRRYRWFDWNSRFNAEYGQSKFGQAQAVKTADLIHSDTYLGWRVLRYLNPYGDLTLDTQCDPLLRPVVLTQSLGVGTLLADRPDLTASIRAGLALKEIYDPSLVLSRPGGQLTVISSPDSSSTVFKMGLTTVAAADGRLLASARLVSEMRLFVPASFGAASLRWDSALYLKISRYLSFKSSLLVLYDYDRDYPVSWRHGVRTRLTNGLGLSWALF